MKFLTLLSLAASAYGFSLFADPVEGESPLGFLSQIGDGAGVNYFSLATYGLIFTYDSDSQILSDGDYKFSIDNNNIAELGTNSDPVLFDGDYLVYQNSTRFYVCANMTDTVKDYILTWYEDTPDNEDCVEVTVSAVGAVSSSSSSAVSSTAPPSSAISATPSASGYFNTTTTQGTTVTDYTTYCPGATTVVVTTCHEEKCAPTSITVTGPTTVTVSGTCVVPTVSPSLLPTTVATGTTTSTDATGGATSSAGSGEVSILASENGAAKNLVGVSAIALFAAMLI